MVAYCLLSKCKHYFLYYKFICKDTCLPAIRVNRQSIIPFYSGHALPLKARPAGSKAPLFAAATPIYPLSFILNKDSLCRIGIRPCTKERERLSASLVRVGVAVAAKRAKQMIFRCEGLDVCLVIGM
jgi:hypothetical protein